jgi:hypothetical protein
LATARKDKATRRGGDEEILVAVAMQDVEIDSTFMAVAAASLTRAL